MYVVNSQRLYCSPKTCIKAWWFKIYLIICGNEEWILFTWTFTILSTLHLTVRTRQLPLLINNQTKFAFANWLMVIHSTLLVQVATEAGAGANTFSIAASRIWSAVIIPAASANNLGLCGWRSHIIWAAGAGAAADMRSSNIALWTLTAGFV